MNVIKESQNCKNILDSIQFINIVTMEAYTQNTYLYHLTLRNSNIFTILVHFLDHAYPKTIENLILNIEDEYYHVIYSPVISEKVKSLCKNKNLGYVDQVGNCYLESNYLFISIDGIKNNHRSKRSITSIYENSSIISSSILRTLLNDPYKEWNLKKLSQEVHCSIGQVYKIKDYLVLNNLATYHHESLKLEKIDELLSEWSNVYKLNKEDMIECYSLDSVSEIESKLKMMNDELGIDYYLTGFAGGVRYSPTVRYNKVHCYIDIKDLETILKYLDCKRVESGGNICFIIPYDPVVLMNSDLINDSYVVSPIQAYLDCSLLKGRGEEIAQGILKGAILNDQRRRLEEYK